MDNKYEDLIKSWIPDPERLAKPEVQKALKEAQSQMGYSGRMMSGSKSGYTYQYPANVPVFNGNLCTKEYGKIWYGDLDLTLDEVKIQKIAKALSVEIYVLRERAARFENENNPQFDEYLVKVSPQGETTFNEESYDCKIMTRATKGKLSKKIVLKPEFRRKK